MDYIEIILRGYSNENDRDFFSKYFIRESKKAEKEFYDYEVFFSGLLNAIKTLKEEYKTRLYKRKNELYFMLDGAKNGTLNYGNSENKSIEELHKQTIEYCESELAEISFENFPINLLYFTKNRFIGHLYYSEVLFIENKITEAYNKLKETQHSEQLESSIPKKNEHIITDSKGYVSLIVDSYFDAQESLGNDPDLIDLVKDLFKQTILRVGKKQEKENYMTANEYNSRIYFALESMKECGYYDDWKTINNTEFIRIERIIKDLKRPISRVEFKNIGDWIHELTTENQPQQPEPLDFSDSTHTEKEIIVIKEPHGEIFSNNGFQLFEHILDEYVKQKNTIGRYEDLSYYYRCLFEDKFIHQKPEPFRLWFIEKYSDEFSKIKTKLQTTSPQRKKDYSTALEWFKRQNK